MKKLIAVVQAAVLFTLIPTLAFGAEIRLLGNRDLSWGSGTWVSAGGATVYRINADIIPFSQDNAVKVGSLYYFASVATTGTTDNCLKSNGDNTFFWGACTDNASNLSSGEVSVARGGFGQNLTGASGFPLFTAGVLSWKTVTQFLALVGITFNSADNTWVFVAPATITGNLTVTGEITAAQVNTTCSYADNSCGWNASVLGRPAAPAAGDCIYDNTIKRISCYNGSGWDNVAVEP